MKLFENGVGRPSKETLEKRRIVSLVIVTVCISLVSAVIGFGTILLCKTKTNNLIGSSSSAKKVERYYIHYDNNGGTEAVGTTHLNGADSGKSAKLYKSKLKKEGYTFIGWHAYTYDYKGVEWKKTYKGCTTNGTCTKSKSKWLQESQIKSYYLYKDGESIKEDIRNGGQLVLVAQWKKNSSIVKKTTKKKCELKFDYNGFPVKTRLKTLDISSGQKIRVSNITSSKSNYKFLGWVVKSNNLGKFYNETLKISKLGADDEVELLRNDYVDFYSGECSSSNSKPGATATASYVGVEVKKIRKNSAIINWISKGKIVSKNELSSPKIRSFTIYLSDKKSIVGKKVETHRPNKTSSTWEVSKLKPNTYYLASVKFEDFNGNEGLVVNKLFKTSK